MTGPSWMAQSEPGRDLAGAEEEPPVGTTAAAAAAGSRPVEASADERPRIHTTVRGEAVTPIVAWAATAWVAAMLGWAAAPPASVRGVLLGGGALLALVAAAIVVAAGRRRRGDAPAARSVVATVVGMVLVAAVTAGSAHVRAVNLDAGPLAEVARRGGSVTIEATIASEPSVRPDGSAWLLATVTRVERTPGRWRVVVGGLRDPPPVGSHVAATVTARPLGRDGFDASLRRRHVVVRVDPVRWDVVAPPSGLLGWVEGIRATVRTAARRGLHGDAAALAVGLVTGDTRGLSEDTADDMRATGLTHLVAVSGSNVALVLAVVAVLSAALPPGWRRAAMVAAIVAFTILTRVEPSVLRAAVMAAMVVLARVRGVPGSAVHALAATMLVLLLVDPASAGSLGLVLSALATAGVLVVAPVLLDRLRGRLPGPLATVLAATLGAQVAVAPVLLTTVGEVPLVSIPANLLAVPAAAVASVVAVVASLVAQVHVGLGAVLFSWAGLPLAVVLAVAERSAGPVMSLARPTLLVAVVSGVAAVLARPRSRWRRVAVAGVAVVALVSGATGIGPRPLPPGLPGRAAQPSVLAVTAIDVGQGDAVLVTTASGHRILVDAGGDDTAATWLRRHGIDHLDLVVLTHLHADHVGGLPDVLDQVHVATLWLAPGPRDPPGLPALVPTADGPREVPTVAVSTVAVRAGMVAAVGTARVEVLGPPAGWALVGTEGGRNDQSVVLRIAEGDRVALLTGDAEVAAQHWLLANTTDLRASLLKVPHHGAATSDPAFLAAVAPDVALVSVGRDNDYGHPAPDLLGWLADLDVEMRRTDQDGTVTVAVPARPP